MIHFTFQHTKPNDFNISPADQQDQDLVLTTEQQKELFGKDDGVSSLARSTDNINTFRRPNNFGLSIKVLHFESRFANSGTQHKVELQSNFLWVANLPKNHFENDFRANACWKTHLRKRFCNLQSCRPQWGI